MSACRGTATAAFSHSKEFFSDSIRDFFRMGGKVRRPAGALENFCWT